MRGALLLLVALLGGCGDDPCANCPSGTHHCVQVPSPPGTPLFSGKSFYECQAVLKVIERLETLPQQ